MNTIKEISKQAVVRNNEYNFPRKFTSPVINNMKQNNNGNTQSISQALSMKILGLVFYTSFLYSPTSRYLN